MLDGSPGRHQRIEYFRELVRIVNRVGDECAQMSRIELDLVRESLELFQRLGVPPWVPVSKGA